MSPTDNATPTEAEKPADLRFAEELVEGGREFAARWVLTNDFDDAGALLQWARAVVSGIPRQEASGWVVASQAWARWMDEQDGPASAPAAPVAVVVERLTIEEALREMVGFAVAVTDLLDDVVTVVSAPPLGRHVYAVGRIREWVERLQKGFIVNTPDGP